MSVINQSGSGGAEGADAGAAFANAGLQAENRDLVVANRDLSRRNDALVIARDRFQALYELTPLPYVTVDAAGVIVDLNPAAEAILDPPRARLLGTPIERFVDEPGRDRIRRFVATVFADGQGRCGDVVVVRSDAVAIDVLIDGVMLRADPDEPRRCVLAFVDITARKVAEGARRRAQEEMLAIVSHDLRGPINAIGLACDALASGLEPDEHLRCVAAIERAAARCERLITDLLGVAHIESGRLKLELAPIDAGDVVRQVCRDLESQVASVGVTLTVTAADGPAPILGDRDRLHQVLSNLIRNALVHARGAAIEVEVTHRRDDQVVIAVTDVGPGIPAEEQAGVFDRYRQGAGRRRGAGLGLAIVKGLVEAHSGTVELISSLGHGARFEIVLPRRADESAPTLT